MFEALKIIGAILGVIAFLWKVWDAVTSYLHIQLSISPVIDGSISALTVVENKRVIPRRIDNALLLVGPETECPVVTYNTISCPPGKQIKSTNEIVGRRASNDVCVGPDGRQLIPLPFYYSENLKIGDEELSYRAQIDTGSIPKGISYSIRFFIRSRRRYHRSTQDSFSLNSGSSQVQ